FWNIAVVKRSGDVTRLQALVDKKRIVITEEVVHEILQLNDAEGVVCLSNEEIFAGLARIGYEKPSTKLTFYKAFFSTQWKFLIHTILHSLSAKRTSWNEVWKGFSGVETPLFKTMLVVRDIAEEAEAQVPAQEGSSLLFQRVLDTCSALVLRVEGLENDKAAQQLEIVNLKARVKKLEKINTVKSSKLRRLRKEKDAEVQGRHADKEAEIYNIDLDHSLKVLKYAKKLQEEMDTEHEEAYKNIDWNAALDHVQSKEPQYIKRYHGIKKKPQTESEARKNMISYLKNTEADDLKKILEILQDEDDDVFVEATPLAQKVPVVDYQVVVIDNKPKYKIIRADDTHQFYISFTTLLKNFDREVLGTLFYLLTSEARSWRS
nr:hypothetical protein [Tanacetum cinerariifolium]